jgi:hypothetical protein
MHKAGDEITLTGLRQGSPITIKAKLSEKEMVISENDGSALSGQFGQNFAVTVPNIEPLMAERLAPLMADGDDAQLVVKENDQTLKVSLKDGQRHWSRPTIMVRCCSTARSRPTNNARRSRRTSPRS